MRSVGRYRILESVGRGAMGTVYRGHDPFLDVDVALKVMHRDAHDDPEQARLREQLFYNETRTAGMLSHPSIVQVYDAGVEDGDYYIAMEYVDGAETLDSHCHPRRLLPVKDAADVVFKCAEALDYAHSKGVIHRDVKPGNVLLTRDLDVKVADFGIAVLIDAGLSDTELIPTAGSPLYMAPEQLREESVTNQSDLFSLGVVLYELITGVHPFAGETLAAVTHRVLEHEPAPAGELRPGVPSSLEGVLRRALAKSPADRYPRAYDLAADLGLVFSELHHPRDGFTTESRAEALKQLAFFDSFPDAEIWELLRWAVWEEHGAGGAIITEGEEDDSFYIVVQGEVDVRKGDARVAGLGPGECFGEIGYLAHQRRSASIVARDGATVLRINVGLLDRASRSCQIQFQRVFIRTLIERLVQTTAALVRNE